MDVGNVRIGQLAGGTVISAQEESRINCVSGVVLYGSVSYVVQAVQMSTVILHPSCAFSFENTPHMNAIMRAELKSLIVTGAPWVGDSVGEKYICLDSAIYGATTIPGTDSSSVNNCLIR